MKKSKSSSKAKANYLKIKKYRFLSILFFCLSILFIGIIFFNGTNLWNNIKLFFFGVFGINLYFIPFIFIYLSIVFSKLIDFNEEFKFKFIHLIGIYLSFCGIIQYFFGNVPINKNIFDIILNFYQQGTNSIGSGIFGFFTYYIFYFIFGKVPAFLILLVFFIMFLLLFSGKGIQDLKFFNKDKKDKNINNIDISYKNKKNSDPINIKTPKLFNIETDNFKNKKSNKNIDIDISSYLDDNLNDEHDKRGILQEEVKVINKTKHNKNENIISDIDIDSLLVNKKSDSLSNNNFENSIKTSNVNFSNFEYEYPNVSLLDDTQNKLTIDNADLKENAKKLIETLNSFGVKAKITEISRGPVVTRYELQPDVGVKISKITSLSDDIALSLASSGIRIEAPIPNKSAVGIEVPNKNVDIVKIKDIIDSKEFNLAQSKLSVALGKDISGNVTIADLSKMPHLLVAGATGSGKSVCINTIISSILFKASPKEVKLLMIDPKVVELGIYNGIPHLLVPVVTDPKKASGALSWAVSEMLKRYNMFAESNVRDLSGYNKLASKNDEMETLPQIVIIIDELADLMMASPKEIEDSICRLAQMARAAGMHLIIATQRPSVDVITGVIKANIPSRIAFAVSSQVDSRTILDSAGAEKLLGRGDMLYYPVGSSKATRIQGCYINDDEVERIVSFVKNNAISDYDEDIIGEIERQAIINNDSKKMSDGDFVTNPDDPIIEKAIEIAVELGQISTSLIQRKLRLGYARAARIVDQLEEMGIVSAMDGSKPRQVLISRQQWIEMRLNKDE